MTDLSPLRQFLASWFVDSEGPDGDEKAARRFAASTDRDSVRAALDAAGALASGPDDPLVTLIDTEANRFFDSPAEAREWLRRMCEAIRREMGEGPPR